MSLKTDYAIVGAGIAGIAAAEAIREVDSVHEIFLINGEGVPPYCRPLIIEVLTGKRAPDAITLRDEEWYKAHRISVFSGYRAIQIEPEKKLIRLTSGQSVQFEKLLVATGSKPLVPSIPGLDHVPWHTLFYRSDTDFLKSLCHLGRKALVLGIGLIGVQAIMALKELGIDITAVELKDKVLPLILDQEAAQLAMEHMEAHGVKIHLGTAVREINSQDGPPFTAITDHGKEIEFDFCVITTGVKPEISLLHNTGINMARGVKVSPTMETSIPGIYAAGDVTEYFDWIVERDEIHAHWINAYNQGRIAGLAMAGAEVKSYEPMYLNSLSIFGLPVIAIGASYIDDPTDTQVLKENVPHRQAYTRLLVREGRFIAATFINDIDRAGMFHYLMREKVDISEVSSSLLVWGIEGINFLFNRHQDVVKGTIEWPPSMDRIEKYQKDLKRTRWGSEKK